MPEGQNVDKKSHFWDFSLFPCKPIIYVFFSSKQNWQGSTRITIFDVTLVVVTAGYTHQ